MARPRKSDTPTVTSEVELGVSKNRVNEDSILKDVTYAGVNPWTSFNSWIGDMDLNSPIPEILLESPSINNLTLLYHFVQFPLVFIYINNTFNNYNLLVLDKASVLKMLKEIIYYTRFRPKYMKTEKKVEDDKLIGILKSKYPYFRKEEIYMASEILDKYPQLKEDIYEMYGLRSLKSKKVTKKEFKEKLQSIVTKQSLLEDL